MAPFVPDPSIWYTVTSGLNNGLQMGCGDPTNGSASVFLGNANADTIHGKWQFLPTNGTDAGLVIRVQQYGLYGDPHGSPHCMNIDYQPDSPGGSAYTPVMSACNNKTLPPANQWNIKNDTFGTTYFWHGFLGENYRMFHLPQTGQMNFTIYDRLATKYQKEASWEITPEDRITDKNWLTPPAPFNASSSSSSTSSSAPSPPPTSSASSSSPTSSAEQPPPPSSNSNAGAIAGGVIGGVAGLALIIAAIFFWMRRSRKRNLLPQQEPPTGGQYHGAQHDRYAYEKAELDSRGVLAEADSQPAHHKPAAYDPHRPSSDQPPVEMAS